MTAILIAEIEFKIRTKGADLLKCLTDPEADNRQWRG